MKKSGLEKELTVLIGHVKRHGATQEELKTLVDAIFIARKYLMFYQKKEEP